MKIQYIKENVIHIVLYVLFLVTYLITLCFFGMGENISKYRYFTLAIAMGIALLNIILNLKNKKKTYNEMYNKNLLLTIIICIVFLIESFIIAINVNQTLNMRTFVQLSLILLPSLYAFGLVNIFSTKTIINFMKFTFIMLVIIYFCESPHTLIDFFNFDNWKEVNLLKFYSFTESNICSEAFLQLFLFFFYFKNVENENISKKSLKIYSILAFIFTILSFKRLGIVFAITIVLLYKLVDFRGKVPKYLIILLPLLFTIATKFYTEIMQGTLFTNIDVYNLTTGRDYILSLWENKDYLSYGYGTSMLVIGRYLEMDLIQIYLELNIFSLFAFCYVFFRMTERNVYSILIMSYAFLNMLTASSLPYSLGWVILLITVSCISSDKCEDEKLNIGISNQKFRRLFQKKEKII